MQTEPKAPGSGRYEDDFYEWTIAQAAAVRDGRWADIDVENLAEEIDSLGSSNKKEIRSRLQVLIARLLKQHIQPERETRSWETTILTQAREIENVVMDSPSVSCDAIRRASPEKMPPGIEERLNAVLAEAAADN